MYFNVHIKYARKTRVTRESGMVSETEPRNPGFYSLAQTPENVVSLVHALCHFTAESKK